MSSCTQTMPIESAIRAILAEKRASCHDFWSPHRNGVHMQPKDPFLAHPMNAAGFREPPSSRPWPKTPRARRVAGIVLISVMALIGVLILALR
jgi:hypothetical protein